MGNPMTPFVPQQQQAAPFLGTVIASAAPSSTGSADIISAATNANGIIITSVFISSYEGTAGESKVDFKINGNTLASVIGNRSTDANIGTVFTMCNIQVPAGQSVSYTFTEGSVGNGNIIVSYKVAGSP
jgi:hypothetical protein